ncbi:MAG TPA: ThiF family adenylyltransferase [Tepidisphaeraceae bacterium]|nr:ThiF family adenylyltransferase [Tepidisphaeraceae bacterium]
MISRYHRQELLPQIGTAGQQKIQSANVALIGCGALGTVVAEHLVRAGVGTLRLIDRDIVEWTNLQRQTLYTEADAREGAAKVFASAERLKQINSKIQIEPIAADLDAENIEKVLGFSTTRRPDLILDGTDNIETRYLINDVAVKHGVPWVYAAGVGTEGRVMGIVPGISPCLRCIFPDAPAAGDLATCDTAGVLAPVTAVIASLAVVQAFKILLGDHPRHLISVDAWKDDFRSMDIEHCRDVNCVCCGKNNFEFLNRAVRRESARLCGRDAVQVYASGCPDLAGLAQRLSNSGEIRRTPYMLRIALHDPAGITLSIFPDGRAIIAGTCDIARARSVAARFLGS